MPDTPIETREEADETERVFNMTLSQLGRTVLRGQRITVWLPEGEFVSGYLAGMDDEAWFILEPENGKLRQYLIRRPTVPVLEIHAERTYAQEPLHHEMEKIIIHLRTWFSKNVFAKERST